jgi:GNAT superfamily N-acetyltransferase
VSRLLGAAPGDQAAPEPPYVLREPRSGDMGWVIHRHGALYAREYGYDQRFEALVAEIIAQFVCRFDPARERCWIAERRGEIVGSVFLVRKTKMVGKLRLLLVEPHARGLGIGGQLVAETIRFARAAGYHKLTLWTQSELDAARQLYTRAGFQRVGEHKHESFGKRLVAETWELSL